MREEPGQRLEVAHQCHRAAMELKHDGRIWAFHAPRLIEAAQAMPQKAERWDVEGVAEGCLEAVVRYGDPEYRRRARVML